MRRQKLSYKLRLSLNPIKMFIIAKLRLMDLQSSLIEIISFFLSMSSSFGLGKHLINVLIQLQVESFEVISNHFFFRTTFTFRVEILSIFK